MKKRLTLVLFVFALAGFLVTQAQSGKMYLGVKAGLGIPNLTAGSTTTPLSEGYTSRLGFYGGITASRQLGTHLALRGEINYSAQGGKRNGMQALPLITPLEQLWQALPGFGITPDKYMYADIKSDAVLDYLEIPLMAKYSVTLGSRLNVYLQAGPYMGILMHAKNVTSGSSAIFVDKAGRIPVDPIITSGGGQAIGDVSFDHTENITSDVHRFNVGGEGAAGFEMTFGPGKLFLEGGGNYGFLNIQKDAANGSNHTGAGTVTVGYMVGI
jgi:hypothetical protein